MRKLLLPVVWFVYLIHSIVYMLVTQIRGMFLKNAMVSKVSCDITGPITTDIIEKPASVNNTSHCHLLRQNSPYLLNDPCIYN